MQPPPRKVKLILFTDQIISAKFIQNKKHRLKAETFAMELFVHDFSLPPIPTPPKSKY